MDQAAVQPMHLKTLRAELAQVKSELKTKERLFDNIVESSLSGYWLWNLQDDSLFLSPSYKKMFGYKDDEMESSKEAAQGLMNPKDFARVQTALESMLTAKKSKPCRQEVRFKHKDGSTIWVLCTGSVFERDEAGNPKSVLGCHVNITDLKKAKDLQKYAEELELKNLEMEQLAYFASHDLQEPLNTIKSFSTLLRDKLSQNEDQEVEEYLKFISQGTDRMKGLIKGLLSYSKIGKESDEAEVDCNELVKGIVVDLTALIHEKKAEVTVSELPTVLGYPAELRAVFQNLISNGLKYNKSRKPKVIIKSEKMDEYWKFVVKDNGIGVPLKDRSKIFKLHQRLHTNSEIEGTGLGLAHCQKIVEDLHHGRIWVERNPKGGSAFCFTIPRK